MTAPLPLGRAAIAGTVTALVVTLRLLATVATIAAAVLRSCADVIAAGRCAPTQADTTSEPSTAQGALLP